MLYFDIKKTVMRLSEGIVRKLDYKDWFEPSFWILLRHLKQLRMISEIVVPVKSF